MAFIAAAAAVAPAILHLGAKVGKFYGKHGNTPLGQAAQFGLGYGAATNIGYNFSNNYITGGNNKRLSTTGKQYNLMPYGYYPRRRYSRYSRFGRRRYYRRYRSYRRY